MKEKETDTPVIIRRELIITDEDKKKEKKQEEKNSQNRKDVGFVEREKKIKTIILFIEISQLSLLRLMNYLK